MKANDDKKVDWVSNEEVLLFKAFSSRKFFEKQKISHRKQIVFQSKTFFNTVKLFRCWNFDEKSFKIETFEKKKLSKIKSFDKKLSEIESSDKKAFRNWKYDEKSFKG